MAIVRKNYTSTLPTNVTTDTRNTTFDCGSGADFLACGINTQDVGATFVSSTYNGVSMTPNSAGASSQAANAGRYMRSHIYYMVAPSTGSNTGTVTMSEAVSNGFRSNYAAYSGVDQTTPEDDADWGSTNSGLSVSLSLTASVAGTWLYAVGENESAAFDVLTTWVLLYSSSSTHGDSNGDLSSGSITAEAGYSDGTARIIYNAILIKPAGGATSPHRLLMMDCGI